LVKKKKKEIIIGFTLQVSKLW